MSADIQVTPSLRLLRLAALLEAYGSIQDSNGKHDANLAAPFPETDVRWLLNTRDDLITTVKKLLVFVEDEWTGTSGRFGEGGEAITFADQVLAEAGDV